MSVFYSCSDIVKHTFFKYFSGQQILLKLFKITKVQFRKHFGNILRILKIFRKCNVRVRVYGICLLQYRYDSYCVQNNTFTHENIIKS